MNDVRRGDFTHQAEAYGRARPSYPAGIVEALVGDAGAARGDAVLELGAGTGLFTRELCARGFRVTASEPNAAMRAQVAPGTPEADAAWTDGTFEAPGVEPATQAWAVAAQAFHWADPPRALPAIRRTLDGPGRAFALLWNVRDIERSDVLVWTLEHVERVSPGFDEGYKLVDWAEVLTSTGDFADVRTHVARHAVRMSAARFVDLWRSHNHLNSTAPEEAVRELLEALEAYLRERRIVELDVPYECRAWTAYAT